ncbi:Rho GDP-dissociation inhibitor 1, partial [Cucurbita argyrosperma subsp. argyrosperma]
MEVGKRVEEEAGPSSAGKIDELRGEKLPQTASGKQSEESEVGEEEVDDKEGFTPGPLLSLKEQIDKDKDDESLRRWKEKLLGCLESDLSEQREPEVKFHSIGIISDEYGEIITPLPVNENQGGRVLFTLREGSRYQLRLTFTVMHNIVSGLSYSNKVWRGGLLVDRTHGMLGTFAPQREQYVETLEEETTPSGVLARGNYSAKLKFEDDDKRCYMELPYSFEIKKGS